MTDTYPVALNARTGADPVPSESPTARLTECEGELGAIATDVGELAEELERVRSYGHELGLLLAERDETLARQRRMIAALEEERVQHRECVQAASEGLRSARARTAENDLRIDELGRENRALRAYAAERERLRERAEEGSRQAREALAEREKAFENERSSRRRVALEAKRLQDRIAVLEGELAAASVHAAPDASELEGEADGAVPPAPAPGHVRLITRPEGYRLLESSAPCPLSGERIDVEGSLLVVIRTGRSPLPGDDRPCAFLLPA